MKANVNGECMCWSLHVRPVASFNCLLSNSKKNLQSMKVAVTAYDPGYGLSLSLSLSLFHRMYDALRWPKVCAALKNPTWRPAGHSPLRSAASRDRRACIAIGPKASRGSAPLHATDHAIRQLFLALRSFVNLRVAVLDMVLWRSLPSARVPSLAADGWAPVDLLETLLFPWSCQTCSGSSSPYGAGKPVYHRRSCLSMDLLIERFRLSSPTKLRGCRSLDGVPQGRSSSWT